MWRREYVTGASLQLAQSSVANQLTWFSHEPSWLLNLHGATAEIQAIPRDPSPFFMHSGHIFYLAMYSKQHLTTP